MVREKRRDPTGARLRVPGQSDDTEAAYRVAAFETFLSGRISTFGDIDERECWRKGVLAGVDRVEHFAELLVEPPGFGDDPKVIGDSDAGQFLAQVLKAVLPFLDEPEDHLTSQR
jgi:hypothetical protein